SRVECPPRPLAPHSAAPAKPAASATTRVMNQRMVSGLVAVFGSFKLSSRLKRNVARPNPVRRTMRQAACSGLGVLQRVARPAAHDLLLGTGQPGAGDIASGAVDHAELVPGEGILAVASDRGAQHL